jgi:hypothetical protein
MMIALPQEADMTLTKIEAGHYKGEGFEVFRVRKERYSGGTTKHVNRWGGFNTCRYATDTFWTLVVGTKVVKGFPTRASAVAAFLEHHA